MRQVLRISGVVLMMVACAGRSHAQSSELTATITATPNPVAEPFHYWLQSWPRLASRTRARAGDFWSRWIRVWDNSSGSMRNRLDLRYPFVALGGGTCVNGGWYPPGMGVPPPTPSPTPVPGGCLTPDPFVALGGGRCINGGWYPPGMGSSATPK